MRTITPKASRIRTLFLLLTIPISAGACADAISDPMAALVAQETRTAVDFGGSLPSMAEVWVESGGTLDAAPLARWEQSWQLAPGEGRALRALIYDDAAPDLFGRLGPDEVERLLVDLDSTLARADRLSVVGIPERLSRRVDLAREMLSSAWILAQEGEGARSLTAMFKASDHLLEVTPRHVAGRLLTFAEEGVGRFSAQDSYSEEMQGRVERLVDVARDALEDGDFARAIRGSYYVCLLLGIELPD